MKRFPASIVLPLLWFAYATGVTNADSQINIIPKPVSVAVKGGRFRLTPETFVAVSGSSTELRFVAEQFISRVRSVTGLPFRSQKIDSKKPLRNGIILRLDPRYRNIPKEGYQLRVTRDSVSISASSGAGIYYGVQSLIQLFPPAVRGAALTGGVDWSAPCVDIVDSARFKWRGMHLDVGRHFFPKEFVMKYIDLMASYKLNTFHWHLTEDQGWRIEIKKYPALTDIGSRRSATTGDSTPYGGFYTQKDIREVVQFARERFVTVVPEIEMPGHSLAALAAYPDLSCTGGPFNVGTEWGVFDDVYCAGNDRTFNFLEEVLMEVMKLFPGEVIHIGGDEVPKTRWKGCAKCQARMRSEGLSNEGELQSYFVRRIEKFLNSKGKRIIGWDEILEGGIAPNASVMSWRGTDGGIAAAKAGHDAVMTPGSYCYFDHYQAKAGEPKAIGGFLPIDSVYAYEPVPSILNEQEAAHILGAQGNMWTEYIPDEKHVEYMLAPRMLALSEMLWLPAKEKNFPDFTRRLNVHYDRLALRGVNFRVPPPTGGGGRTFIFGDTSVAFHSSVDNSVIRYTTDGSAPNESSLTYTRPIRVSANTIVSVRTFLWNGRGSNPLSTSFVLVDPKIDGLDYAYYEGTFDSLPDFSTLVPTSSGTAFDLSVDEIPHREENFAMKFSGFFSVDTNEGTTYYLTSDDGSRLFIDEELVADNNGLHGPRAVATAKPLSQGKHTIRAEFFQKTGGATLLLEVENSAHLRQRVPIQRFSRR